MLFDLNSGLFQSCDWLYDRLYHLNNEQAYSSDGSILDEHFRQMHRIICFQVTSKEKYKLIFKEWPNITHKYLKAQNIFCWLGLVKGFIKLYHNIAL